MSRRGHGLLAGWCRSGRRLLLRLWLWRGEPELRVQPKKLTRDRVFIAAVLDELDDPVLAADLSSAESTDALVDALLRASDLLRQSEAPELGSRCCRLGARLAAEDARC